MACGIRDGKAVGKRVGVLEGDGEAIGERAAVVDEAIVVAKSTKDAWVDFSG